MKDYICKERHPNASWGGGMSGDYVPRGVRCWKRENHEGSHLAVMPNRNLDVLTRPQVLRWGSQPLVGVLG